MDKVVVCHWLHHHPQTCFSAISQGILSPVPSWTSVCWRQGYYGNPPSPQMKKSQQMLQNCQAPQVSFPSQSHFFPLSNMLTPPSPPFLHSQGCQFTGCRTTWEMDQGHGRERCGGKWAWRGWMVKSTCRSLRGPESDSQHPQQVAYSHMKLQLQELQLHLLAILYTHGIDSHRHRCRSNKNENKIF